MLTSRRQIGCATPGISMGLPPFSIWSHGQHGSGPVKRLDLRFLIHGNHKGIVWRTEVKTKDIHLLALLQIRVRTFSAPLVDFVRLYISFIENSMNCCL